ncbi:hypothetical protein [Hyalangium versicolor]|uniref:hypothetical protein n=1 Tax=Hyalangium versicolor TaxID=2861190 RepID=UPI001CCE4486|nr:hypothetical protein [Hyalangium versicolor]
MASPFVRAPGALPLPQWEDTPPVLEAPPRLAYLLNVVEARARDLRELDEEIRARNPRPPEPPSGRPELILEPTPPGAPRKRRTSSRRRAAPRVARVAAAAHEEQELPWADPADVVEVKPLLTLVPPPQGRDEVPWADPADVVELGLQPVREVAA